MTIKIIGGIILGIITLAVWWYRSRYDPDVLRAQVKQKLDAELKRLNKEIDDVTKDLNDAINLADNDSVNRFSSLLKRLCQEQHIVSAKLSKSDSA
jgi:hypothetical protein